MRMLPLAAAASLGCIVAAAFQVQQHQPTERIPGINALPTLQTAAARGQASVVDMLLKLRVNPNAIDAEGKRALNIACLRGDVRIVEMLLAGGANPNLRDGASSLPLRDAALNGNRAVGELLLTHGAEVDAQDPDTYATALYEAVSFKRADFAKLLIEAGAATKLKTKSGRTILDTAIENGLTAILFT